MTDGVPRDDPEHRPAGPDPQVPDGRVPHRPTRPGAPAPTAEELFGDLRTASLDLPRGDGAPDDGSHAPAHAAARQGPVGVLAPSRGDPVVRLASQVIGGPAGRRAAAASGFWRAATVLVLLAIVTMSLAVVERQHCRAEGWSSPDQFFHLCYSDVPVLYGSAGLGGPDRPGLVEAVAADGPLAQPPLTSALLWVVSAAVPSPAAADAPRMFFDLSAALLGGALAVAVVCVAVVAGRRRWDAAHLAVAPVVVTAGLISYDLFAVALACAGLVAWSRDRVATAGVLLGLAVAVRPTYAVLAVVLGAVALRAGVLARAGVAVGVGVATCLALRVLLLPGWLGQLGTAFSTWRRSQPGYGSVWLVPQLLAQSKPANAPVWFGGDGLGPTSSTVLSLLGLTLVAVGVVAVALTARRRPRTAHLALLAVVGCLLVAKSVPVQASLLLLPFVAWAGLRWRDHLVWATAELVYFVGVWLYIGGLTNTDRGVPGGLYVLLLLIRLGAMVWLAVQAVRAVRDPLRDPVRRPEDGGPGTDDPLGGSAADAPDALVVRLV